MTERSTKSIFLSALEIEDTASRLRFVDEACQGDEQQRCLVKSLLRANAANASSPLDRALALFNPRTPLLTDSATANSSTASAGIATHYQLPNGTQIGAYVIRELLGQGGMGQVYVAEQMQPVRRKVALKVIHAGLASDEMLARFAAEGQALAMMDHPNISKVLELGTTDQGLPYFAMELVNGVPITEYADSHRLSTEHRLSLFSVVCLAVRHAHRKGVIHRDLKPSNVLVGDIDGAAVPKVIDFGLAKAIEMPLVDQTIYTGFRRLLGTPMYMSPEQASMGVVDVDTRSDVYSLGVMLYELLAGVPPFDRKTLRSAGFDEVRRIVREVEPTKPSAAVTTLANDLASTVAEKRSVDVRVLRAKLRGELDWIVMKAMDKVRDRRYESVGEFAEDIQRFLNNDTVRACPPSRWYRCQKFIQRNTMVLLIVGIILAALIATTAVATWRANEIRLAKMASEARERRANVLLEAMQLQTALSYFRQGELGSLAKQLDAWQLEDPLGAQWDSLAQDGNGSGTRLDPSPLGLRDLLQSTARPEPIQMLQHTASVQCIAVSSDCSRVLAVDVTGGVNLWRVEKTDDGASGHTGDETDSPVRLGTHAEQSDAVAISPDGTRAVTGSRTGWLIFWDLELAHEIKRIHPLTTGVETICWSPDGHRIAAGARYSEAWIGDADGNEKFRIANDQRHDALLFSKDSKELFLPTRGGLDVWDVASGERARSIDTRPLKDIRTLCFAGKNQQWLVAGERYSELLVVFDPDSGKLIGQIECGERYARSLAASSDGLWLANSYTSGHVHLIQLSEGFNGTVEGKVRFQFQAHRAEDDSRLPLQWLGEQEFLTAASDATLKRWSLTAIRPWQKPNRPGDQISGILLVANQSQPLIFFYDHLRQTEQARRRNRNVTFPNGKSSANAANGLIAFSQAHKSVIVAAATGEILAELPSSLTLDRTLLLSNDSTALLASGDTNLEIWRTADHWKTHRMVYSMHWPQEDVAPPIFADVGRTLIIDDQQLGRTAEIDIESGQLIREYVHDKNSNAICVSHDRRLLARSDSEGIQLLDRPTGSVLVNCKYQSEPGALAFFPDDRVLLSAHEDGSIRATHIATGHSLGILYQPQRPLGPIIRLQMAPTGPRVAIVYSTRATSIPVILGK